jgi:virginiamycin A acetyltransferase
LKQFIKSCVYPLLYYVRFPLSTIGSWLGWNPKLSDPVFIGRNVDIGKRTSIGRYTCVMDNTQVGDNCSEVGSFCSIARGCVIGTNHHPYHFVTTSSVFSTTVWKVDGVVDLKAKMNEGRRTIIGHDVWIGCNSVVIGGVNIGTGAIVGAGSVVTKDVPPYAIVAGTPARVIGRRFDDALVEDLLASCWWEWPVQRIHPLWEDVRAIIDQAKLDRQ